MDLQKGFPVVQNPIEDVLEALSTCCACGTKLIFRHETDYLNSTVIEKGCCPQCGIKLKENNFILQ